MKVIEYTPEGVAVSDFDSDAVAKEVADSELELFRYSTSNVIMSLRVLVAREEIPHDSISFLFRGETLTIDKNACMSRWPYGFIDQIERQCCEILNKRVKK